MLKIDEGISRHQLPPNILNHLELLPIGNIKSAISLLTFLVLDLIVLLPMISDPFIKGLLMLIAPFIIFINIWAILLVIRNAYSTQLETVLFLGILGFITAISLLILSQKIAYFVVGMKSLLFFVICLIIYIVTVIYFIFYCNKVLSKESKKKKSTRQFSWPLLYTTPAIGYIVYHSFIKKSGYLHHVMILVFYLLGMLFIYISVKFLHKYLFIKNNSTFVVYQEPSKKEQKQANEKGKEIIVK